MTWAQSFQVLRPSGPFADLDRHRAWRPSVLQSKGAMLRMWYAGHDGSTGRILAAEQHPRLGWSRLGISIEPGFAGPTDVAGVDAPSVVDTPAGYLMAYAGSDGTDTRIHLAESVDGDRWHPSGPVGLGNGHGAATAPCLVADADRLWLYHAAEGDDGRTSIVAATSVAGGPWSSAGPVLEPDPGEHSVSEPWVVAGDRGLLMFFVARDPDGCAAVAVASSDDGLDWSRRPAPIDLCRRHDDTTRIGGPSALRLRGGHLRLWYAAGDGGDGSNGAGEGDDGDGSGACRLWSTDLNGREP